MEVRDETIPYFDSPAPPRAPAPPREPPLDYKAVLPALWGPPPVAPRLTVYELELLAISPPPALTPFFDDAPDDAPPATKAASRARRRRPSPAAVAVADADAADAAAVAELSLIHI